MTVRELLARIDSHELSEWEAYENATGPLGLGYVQETLAELMDEIKISNVMASSQFEADVYPIPDRKHVRAHEMHKFMLASQEKASDPETLDAQDPEVVSEEEFARQLEARNAL